uniref:Uncharacterized protein n=1 Tax=Nelumbo nucifera TaxID=4432 RepID=A0A822ZN37_NELNU|nr:TPA_asm: hypothetical protein HUJ06_001428 [Nelumbo nucifera]
MLVTPNKRVRLLNMSRSCIPFLYSIFPSKPCFLILQNYMLASAPSPEAGAPSTKGSSGGSRISGDLTLIFLVGLSSVAAVFFF